MSGERNPPAFPVVIPDGCGGFQKVYGGMTLRDWFAGQVIGSFRYDADFIAQAGAMNLLPEEHAASVAYAVADAMLAARLTDTGRN